MRAHLIQPATYSMVIGRGLDLKTNSTKIKYTTKQVLDLYMVFGGIPSLPIINSSWIFC